MNRREFMQVLAAASAAGLSLGPIAARSQTSAQALYDLPAFGNVHFLHFTDCHAQLNPIYFREPSVNLGVGPMFGKPPHLVGEHFLKFYGIDPGTRAAHALTYLNFTEAAQQFGRVGGFAHLATLIKQLRASRPGALLLDGGDTWQGSGTALWSAGQDMVDACLMLGVDVMTAHWEMTLGEDRVLEIVENDFADKVAFVAQNIKTTDFEDPVFDAYVMREINGVAVAVIGQAFPYTPIANPRYLVENWSFGIDEENMQATVNQAREAGAQVVVVLSHNGMDVDLKMASRVRGIDAIMGGHTHDGVPEAVKVSNPGGVTLVTNGGSNGKFIGVLDFEVKGSQVTDFRFTLLPVFSDLIAPDPEMTALIERVRAPHEAKLSEVLAHCETTLYRRGNFNGTFDQLIVDALMAKKDVPIAFSPGFRWGTSLLPGQPILMENVLDQTAITYPYTTVTAMTGTMIKTVLEDVADNLFNPDPYYQQGGDMVRVGGLHYTIDPNASAGNRISDMRLDGELIDADKEYRVAGWAPVSEQGRDEGGEPIWDVVSDYLRDVKVIKEVTPNTPRVIGASENPGYSS